eukprot:CAMPEP_0181334402 /NCGR_PEP_ID=MMETSP1101-20121128/26234_1 /TAXON_ID=46948 /ORGANISM="Rhodomonas abbreviata, Strain Caron Lab Isolate" /LENGTH=717 /DNA_ID=CAMNT_0023444363 /DNA_START=95 /DNA_END=2249 /DNA_ORIENTATION=+
MDMRKVAGLLSSIVVVGVLLFFIYHRQAGGTFEYGQAQDLIPGQESSKRSSWIEQPSGNVMAQNRTTMRAKNKKGKKQGTQKNGYVLWKDHGNISWPDSVGPLDPGMELQPAWNIPRSSEAERQLIRTAAGDQTLPSLKGLEELGGLLSKLWVQTVCMAGAWEENELRAVLEASAMGQRSAPGQPDGAQVVWIVVSPGKNERQVRKKLWDKYGKRLNLYLAGVGGFSIAAGEVGRDWYGKKACQVTMVKGKEGTKELQTAVEGMRRLSAKKNVVAMFGPEAEVDAMEVLGQGTIYPEWEKKEQVLWVGWRAGDKRRSWENKIPWLLPLEGTGTFKQLSTGGWKWGVLRYRLWSALVAHKVNPSRIGNLKEIVKGYLGLPFIRAIEIVVQGDPGTFDVVNVSQYEGQGMRPVSGEDGTFVVNGESIAEGYGGIEGKGRLRMRKVGLNESLNERWRSGLDLQTEGVVMNDDDIRGTPRLIALMSALWLDSSHSLVGVLTRVAHPGWYSFTGQWKFHNFMLPRVMVIHQRYFQLYNHPAVAEARQYVKEQEAHCDDVLMNLLNAKFGNGSKVLVDKAFWFGDAMDLKDDGGITNVNGKNRQRLASSASSTSKTSSASTSSPPAPSPSARASRLPVCGGDVGLGMWVWGCGFEHVAPSTCWSSSSERYDVVRLPRKEVARAPPLQQHGACRCCHVRMDLVARVHPSFELVKLWSSFELVKL